MVISIFLSLITTCMVRSAVVNAGSVKEQPFGYAPFVWVSVNNCGEEWCVGKSRTSFALNTDTSDPTNNTCTHYCLGEIIARWQPVTPTTIEQTAIDHYMLGAYVYNLDRKSCIRIPGGFGCSEHVVSTIPLNRLSIMLHAAPKNRDYYFGSNPEIECGTDPQCAAYRLLRRTMYAIDKKWPSSDEVLTIRNSPYACILSYMGLGDTDSLGSCYAQLGDYCFQSEGNRFCINGSDSNRFVGITNVDDRASAPIAICELSSVSDMDTRDPLFIPELDEINAFITPSACDAVIVPVNTTIHDSKRISIDTQVHLCHNLSELAHVILRLNISDCILNTLYEDNGLSSTRIQTLARTISKVMISTYSTALLLDISDWSLGSELCKLGTHTANNNINITTIISALGSQLHNQNIHKVFLRLPRSPTVFGCEDYQTLQRVIHAFVSPIGRPDMSKEGYCQNMWAQDSDKEETEGVLSYVLTTLRRCVPANKFIFTLALTGGISVASLEKNVVKKQGDELPLAELESNNMLKCQENIRTKCCFGSSVSMWGRNLVVAINVTSTSFETLKRYPEVMTTAFGVNQFIISPVDSDFKRGVRSNTPAILGITSAIHRLSDSRTRQTTAAVLRHKRSIDVLALNPEHIAPPTYKDPSSGSKNSLDPQYTVGLSTRIVCPGLIAVHGALGLFKEPYRELYGTRYETIYAANVYKLESCTPGPPSRMARVSTTAPQIAININTMIPTRDPAHYMIGILDSNDIVEYVPVASKVCETYNTGEAEHNMNIVAIDDGYVIETPTIEYDFDVIVKPADALYFVSNFTPGVDYVNLNVKCVNYDVGALQPCLIAICGGDHVCRRDYGRLCNSAHEVMNDARRAGDMMREGLRELAVQEKKAKVYELLDKAPLPWLNDETPQRRHRKKRFLGAIIGASALAYAYYLSTRIDKLETQMDMLQNSHIQITNQLVEVSRKLDSKITSVNGRIDEQERTMKRNTELINGNFALLRDAIMRNTEAAMRDTNVKFSVMASYQMWYAQMQSVTHQLMQAAMHVKFMARGVENCLRQIATKRSGSCPSGLSVIQEHPGLSEFPTVGAALYKDRKLFIVHSVPGTVTQTVIREIIPIPKMSTDGIPCWPDYKVWFIEGDFYEPSECFGKYCHEPKHHHKYKNCRSKPCECKTVCSMCHRGICYNNNRFTWMEGTASVEIQPSTPLRPFSRPHISDGPVSFADLLKDALPDVPEVQVIQAINTSVRLLDIHNDLNNISQTITDFDEKYNAITNSRVTFGGWLSGFASDVALWISIATLMAWCTALSLGIAYIYFCGGGGGRHRSMRYKMMKVL